MRYKSNWVSNLELVGIRELKPYMRRVHPESRMEMGIVVQVDNLLPVIGIRSYVPAVV